MSSFSRLTRSELASDRVRLITYFISDWPNARLRSDHQTESARLIAQLEAEPDRPTQLELPGRTRGQGPLKRLCTARLVSLKSTARPLWDRTPLAPRRPHHLQLPTLLDCTDTPAMDSLAHPSSGSFDSQISFIKHGDLAQPVTIKVASFQGRLPQRPLTDLLDHPHLKHHGFQQALPSDLYVKIELWADNKPLIPSVQTAHKAFKSREQVDWNEHITLPIKYRDLPLNAQLVATVYDIAGPGQLAVVGGSTLRLFGGKCTLRKGKQRLYLWKGVAADPHNASETPSKVGLKDEMGRLEKLVKRHERGDIARLDWLDKLAFRQIEKIHKAGSLLSTRLNTRTRADMDFTG